jgi:hypothetical protein
VFIQIGDAHFFETLENISPRLGFEVFPILHIFLVEVWNWNCHRDGIMAFRGQGRVNPHRSVDVKTGFFRK